MFNAGQRPAVDSGLSVSRVGSAAQIKAMKQVAGSLKIELASYRELQSFSQFGSDLDAETKRVLNHGEKLMEVLKQTQYTPYDVNRQIIELFAAKNRYLDDLPTRLVKNALDDIYTHIDVSHHDIIDELTEKRMFSKELEEKLKGILETYINVIKGKYLG